MKILFGVVTSVIAMVGEAFFAIPCVFTFWVVGLLVRFLIVIIVDSLVALPV